MNVDFHYGAMTVLANWAGFSKEEAATIAYSSQFVDELSFNGEIVFERALEEGVRPPPFSYTFRQTVKQTEITSPEQTVENAVDVTNRDTWVPFHFICSDNTLVTRANNSVARAMVKMAIKDAWAHPHYALHRLGAALHSFADTWAHDGFVGVADLANSVWLEKSDIPGAAEDYVKVAMSQGLWKIAERWPGLFLGHTLLFSYPDFPFLRLKYHRRHYKEGEAPCDQPHERKSHNVDFFLEAAEEIYNYLLRYRNKRLDAPKVMFDPGQRNALLLTMKHVEYDYNESLNNWYERMNTGNLGDGLKHGNFIRYDGGKEYLKWLEGLKSPRDMPQPTAEVIPDETDAAETGPSVTIVPYWVYHTEWSKSFLDSDFFKFCEATKQQRADVARLFWENGIYV